MIVYLCNIFFKKVLTNAKKCGIIDRPHTSAWAGEVGAVRRMDSLFQFEMNQLFPLNYNFLIY